MTGGLTFGWYHVSLNHAAYKKTAHQRFDRLSELVSSGVFYPLKIFGFFETVVKDLPTELFLPESLGVRFFISRGPISSHLGRDVTSFGKLRTSDICFLNFISICQASRESATYCYIVRFFLI